MCFGTGQRFAFSLGQVEARQRLGVMHEIFAGPFPDSHFERYDDGPVHAEGDFGRIGRIGFGYHAETPIRFRNAPNVSAPGNPESVMLHLGVQGTSVFSHGGRTGTVGPGGALIGVDRIPFAFDSPEPVASISLNIPLDFVRRHVGDVDEIAGLALDPDNEALRLMRLYLHGLRDVPDTEDPSIAALVERQIADLFVNAVGTARRAAAPEGSAPGVDAVRAAVVEDLIRRHHANPLLNAARIAAMLGCSPRHVQKLLAARGTTVTEAIHAARMEAAAVKLASPALAHMKVAEIAFSVGYTDAAHFVRVFRRHFGTTPGGYRP